MGERLLGDGTGFADPFARLLVTGVLIEQRPPADADREEIARLARTLAARSASLPDAIADLDAAQARVWSECVSRASRVADAGGVLSGVGSLLASWYGALTVAATDAFARLTRVAELADRDRRAAVVQGVLTGAADPLGLPEFRGADADPEAWRALRARPIAPATTVLLETAIESFVERSGGRVATVGGEVHGIVAAPPRLRREMAYVAVGPPGGARSLPASFATATRVLETAQALDRKGVTTMQDLRLRLAVVESKAVGREAIRRCLDPLAQRGAFGRALRETLSAYVANDARIDPTAAMLGVHANTVRHRLRRYTAITGVDPERVDDLVELWWALAREKLEA